MSFAAAAAAYQPPPIDGAFAGKPIVTVNQFTRDDLDLLLAAAASIKIRVRRGGRSLIELAQGKVMATLFFEASTRTDMSFQAAMSRLGGEVISTAGGVQFSSIYKGENLPDTVRAVGTYADVLVLRHPEVGSSYAAALYLQQLGSRLGRQPCLISAGDGIGEHPTQALLDLHTIIDAKGGLDGLSILMVGDLAHGRTIHSLVKLIARYGARDVRLSFVAPDRLRLPAEILATITAAGIVPTESESLDGLLERADVIYWTRVQEERFADPADAAALAQSYVMTPALLARARADAALMHPLPRRHEMGTPEDHAILDADPRAIYFHQMENGMYVRMALLALVMGVWQG